LVGGATLLRIEQHRQKSSREEKRRTTKLGKIGGYGGAVGWFDITGRKGAKSGQFVTVPSMETQLLWGISGKGSKGLS